MLAAECDDLPLVTTMSSSSSSSSSDTTRLGVRLPRLPDLSSRYSDHTPAMSMFQFQTMQILQIIPIVHYELWPQNSKQLKFLLQVRQMLINVQNSSSSTWSSKFAIKCSLKIPPNLKGLKRVATLPCE